MKIRENANISVFYESQRNFNFIIEHCCQRCRSVFNIGGYNSAFLLFFRDFEILGGYSGFADFSSFNDFENLGYIQVLTKMYLNN